MGKNYNPSPLSSVFVFWLTPTPSPLLLYGWRNKWLVPRACILPVCTLHITETQQKMFSSNYSGYHQMINCFNCLIIWYLSVICLYMLHRYLCDLFISQLRDFLITHTHTVRTTGGDTIMFMNYIGMKYGWLNIVPGIFGLGNFVRLSILSRHHFVWVQLCPGSQIVRVQFFSLHSFMFD